MELVEFQRIHLETLKRETCGVAPVGQPSLSAGVTPVFRFEILDFRSQIIAYQISIADFTFSPQSDISELQSNLAV